VLLRSFSPIQRLVIGAVLYLPGTFGVAWIFGNLDWSSAVTFLISWPLVVAIGYIVVRDRTRGGNR
jgi:hypothetical protein